MNKITIAIDGHAGCGKSTTAKAVAQKLGYIYIDSGAMYRAVTLYFLQHKVDLKDIGAVKKAMQEIELNFCVDSETGRNEIFLNGKSVEGLIRTMEVSQYVSDVSALPEIRVFLVDQQRKLGEQKGIVMDGRDIGTVVFPDAELKVYMTADVQARAERRQQELKSKNQIVDLDTIVKNLEKRDYIDSNRKEGPLRKAEDAVVIDTSRISIEEQVERVLELVLNQTAVS